MIRHFLVEKGTLKRIANTKFNRVYEGEEPMPEYAGKAAEIAEAWIQLVDRKPFRIIQVLGIMLHFNKDGYVDRKALKESIALAMETLGVSFGKKTAQSQLAAAKYNKKFKWTPSPEIIESIRKDIWRVRAVKGNRNN